MLLSRTQTDIQADRPRITERRTGKRREIDVKKLVKPSSVPPPPSLPPAPSPNHTNIINLSIEIGSDE